MADGGAHPRPLRDRVAVLADGLGAAAEVIAELRQQQTWLARYLVLALLLSAAERERRIAYWQARALAAEQAALDMMALPVEAAPPPGFFDVEAGGRPGVLVWD